MTANSRVALRSATSAVFFLGIAWLVSTAQQPFVLRDEYGRVITVRDLTVVFTVVKLAAVIIGVLLIGSAARTFFGSAHDSNVRAAADGRACWTRESPYWAALNAMLIVASIWTGYFGAHPRNYRSVEAPLLLHVSVFVGIIIVILAAFNVAPSARRFRRPGWSRFPLNWSSDPSQALFLAAWCSLGVVVGGVFALAVFGFSVLQTLTLQAVIFLAVISSRAIIHFFDRR